MKLLRTLSTLEGLAIKTLLILNISCAPDKVIATDSLSEDVFMVFDRDSATTPKRFRATTDGFIEERVKLLEERNIAIPSREGLETLNIMGCGQFNTADLQKLITQNQKPDYIVDLRQESHGYIDGQPVSWFAPKNRINVGLNTHEILETEKTMLKGLKGLGAFGVNSIKEKGEGCIETVEEILVKKPKSIKTEKELADALNIHYVRAPVTDLSAPEPDVIESFIKKMELIPVGSRVLMHCRGGAGRTTSFMVLWDIHNNADKVSFDDILLRHYLLGGIDILDAVNGPEYKRAEAIERYEVMRSFYASVLADKITLQIMEEQSTKMNNNRQKSVANLPLKPVGSPPIYKKRFASTGEHLGTISN